MSAQNTAPSIVCLIGPRKILNDLMSRRIESIQNARCVSADNFEEARSRLGDSYRSVDLILLDYSSPGQGSAMNLLEDWERLLPPKSALGLFNAERDALTMSKIFSDRLKGIFFGDDSVEDFTKGISSILEGKPWLPATEAPPALPHQQNPFKPENLDEPLTPREALILSFIEQGKSNRQIGESLGITYKTVKNHINNLFRKLNVANRFQAALKAKTLR